MQRLLRVAVLVIVCSLLNQIRSVVIFVLYIPTCLDFVTSCL